eukprot:g17123.t1
MGEGIQPSAAVACGLLAVARAAGISPELDDPKHLGSTEAARAPAVSVLAPADLEQVPATTTMADVPTTSQTVVLAVYFFCWFALNAGYNIASKRAYVAIDLPWSFCAAQLAVGSIFVLPLWVLRLHDAPGLNMTGIIHLSPIAACHMLSHVCTLVGLGGGTATFVAVIKATEPLFTALLCAVFMKQTFSPRVYLTLVPVVAGVGLASWREFDLTWPAFIGAVGYNLASSTRAVLFKRSMGMDVGKNMSPANLHAVLNIMASATLLPLAAILEGPSVEDVWAATVNSPEEREEVIFSMVASGVLFSLYNEMAFRCLVHVHPVTHAVGSAFKQISFIATSFVVYISTLPALTVVGSYMAIAGVLLYALAGE